MKKIFHLLLFVGLLSFCLTKSHCREVEVKTNILYGGNNATHPSIETALGKKVSPVIQGLYNSVLFSNKERISLLKQSKSSESISEGVFTIAYI